VAGDLEKAWMSGVETGRSIFEIVAPEDADIVVAVPGGRPRDLNLYQGQKSMAAAELVVKKGGSVILPVECPGGVGPDLFFEWMASAACPDDVMARFREEGYDVGTSKAWLYARCLLKAEIIVVSDCLDEETLGQMFTKKAADLDTAIEMALKTHGPYAKVLIMRDAVDMIPRKRLAH
jgi:nickel-dependent lactate racemase